MPNSEEQTTPLLGNFPGQEKIPILLLSLEEKTSYPTQEAAHALFVSKSALVGLIIALIPSFLRRSTRSSAKQKLHPTAYLDGLRGTAAFIVFIHHSIIDWFPALSHGYGSLGTSDTTLLLQLPIVRIVYAGRGMVAVFFIISGYVLSYKALRLMHEQQYSKLLDSFASSAFRRSMRLYLPCIASTFTSLLFCRAGWYIQDPLVQNAIPPVQETFYAQVQHWAFHTFLIVNPFQLVDGRNIYSPPYDGHLWTIPIEFHGSIIVFLILLCLSRARKFVRLALLTTLVFFTLCIAQWHLFLFLSGTLFCDIHFIRLAHIDSFNSLLPSSTNAVQKPSRHRLVQLIACTGFFLGLWMLSFPDEDATSSPGYLTIIANTPSIYWDFNIVARFWLAVGAFLLFLSVTLSPLLQSIFSSHFPQYLGKISFALYIVHGPILYTMGMKLLYSAIEHSGGGLRFAAAFVGSMIVDSAVCFWAADLFWRHVDVRSVTFAGWLQMICWAKDE